MRNVLSTNERRTVSRDGKMYIFSRYAEPTFNAKNGTVYGSLVELQASVWTGVAWKTIHRITVHEEL